jgi:hypothetical protein
MTLQWTAAELEQNRQMNMARSGRAVPKGVKSATCERCRARRSVLALYRTDDARRVCRPCVTGDPVAPSMATADRVRTVRTRRSPRPIAAPEPVADVGPHPCEADGCHSGIAGHHCPMPADRAERHDPSTCHACAVDPAGTEHVGVRALAGRLGWETFDRETGARIGHVHTTRRDALAYAEHRQSTTYAPVPEPEPEPEPVESIAEPELDYSGHDYRPAARGGVRPCPGCATTTDTHGLATVAPTLPAPVDGLTPTDTDRALAQYRDVAAAAVIEPEPEPDVEPVAPILAPVPESTGRPTCPRCGQVFRKSGAGLAWHVANRPDCKPAAPALSVVA